MTLPLTLRFWLNDHAPHFGQRTFPYGSTCVDFIPARYADPAEVAMPKMTHPDTRQVLEVAADAVPMYESQGWVKKAAASAKKSVTKPAATANVKE